MEHLQQQAGNSRAKMQAATAQTFCFLQALGLATDDAQNTAKSVYNHSKMKPLAFSLADSW